MFTLKLRFTGMWVYVPSADIHNNKNELDIVAVETRSEEFPQEHWHFPFLIVERKHVTDHAWSSNKVYRSPDRGARWLAFLLDGRKLSVLAAAEQALSFRLPLDSVGGVPECPADDDAEKDFRWLAGMGRLHPGKGKVDPDIIKKPHMQRHRIAAGVHLSEGEFGTLFVSRDGNGDIIKWKLRGGGQPMEQALAEMMEFRVGIAADHVWFKDELWHPKTVTEKAIQLTPRNGQELVAYFKVVTFNHLWKVEPRRSRRDPIKHFKFLNRPFPGQLPLQDPVPTGNCGNWPPSEVELAPLMTEDEAIELGFPYNVRRFNDPQCPGLAADP